MPTLIELVSIICDDITITSEWKKKKKKDNIRI